MTGLCGVFEDATCLTEAPFQVDFQDGWEHSPSDVLGCVHHPLEGLVVVDGGIFVLEHDATGTACHISSAALRSRDTITEVGVQTQGSELGVELGGNNSVEC